MKKFYLILFLLIVMKITMYAQTVISAGDVTGTWNQASSPYLINGNISVPTGDSLVIGPGVDIVFNDNYSFLIWGKLKAEGSLNDSVKFTVSDTTGFYNNTFIGWGGLSFFSFSASSQLSFTIVEYSNGKGVFSTDPVNGVTLTDCMIRNNGDCGICANTGNLFVNKTQITGNKGNGIIVDDFSSFDFEDFVISGNGERGIAKEFFSKNPDYKQKDGGQKMFNNGIVEYNAGGGISVQGESTVSFTNITIRNNGPALQGGGVFTDGASYFENATVENNSANKGGGFYFSATPSDQTIITNSSIYGNSAVCRGGGVYGEVGNFKIINSTISYNTAYDGGGFYLTGGSVSPNFFDHQKLQMYNNHATHNGGAMYLYNQYWFTPVFERFVIAGNTADVSGGGIFYSEEYSDEDSVILHNSLVWNNAPDAINDTYDRVKVTYTDVEGGWSGNGNFNLDPLFKDITNHDYRLTWNDFPIEDNTKSPCIDAGDPASPADPDGTMPDLGPFFFDQITPCHPQILSILDVPNDQGKQVVINWTKSAYDNSTAGTITQYTIWRLQNWAKEPWEYIGSTPAHQFDEYAFTALTISDSAGTEIPYFTFLVSAETVNPLVYYNSEPDSGYSVDNLPPFQITGFTGEFMNNVVVLNWNPSGAADYDHYALYKTDDPNSFPAVPNITIDDTIYNDSDLSADTLYYYVTAFDHNGNESTQSNIQTVLTGKILDIKVFLEGPFYSNQMIPYLNISGYLPFEQPFNVAPWNYSGSEATESIPNTNIVDWILLDFRDALSASEATASTSIGRQAAFLLNDGSIVGLDGFSKPRIYKNFDHNFFLVIYHRNHLPVMNLNALLNQVDTYSYDFTSSPDQVYGNETAEKNLGNNTWGMITGDADANGQIDNTDKNEGWLPEINLSGYLNGDFNMDGQITTVDKMNFWIPNVGSGSQLPQ